MKTERTLKSQDSIEKSQNENDEQIYNHIKIVLEVLQIQLNFVIEIIEENQQKQANQLGFGLNGKMVIQMKNSKYEINIRKVKKKKKKRLNQLWQKYHV